MGYVVTANLSAELDQSQLRRVFNRYDVKIRLPYPEPYSILKDVVTQCAPKGMYTRLISKKAMECSVAILKREVDRKTLEYSISTVEVVTYDRRTGHLVFKEHNDLELVDRVVYEMREKDWKLKGRALLLVHKQYVYKKCFAFKLSGGTACVPVSKYDELQRYAHCINLFRPRKGRARILTIPIYRDKELAAQLIPDMERIMRWRASNIVKGLDHIVYGRNVTSFNYLNKRIFGSRKLRIEQAFAALDAYERDFEVDLTASRNLIREKQDLVLRAEEICREKHARAKAAGLVKSHFSRK